MMKRTILGLAVALAAFALAACSTTSGEKADPGSPDQGSSSPVLDQILASGELRVGVSGDQPPFNVKTKSGQIIGMEVDLATALGESIGAKARFVQKPFGELLGALEAGEVDMVMSGMAMTPERNTKVAFVGPYFVSGKGLLTKSDELAQTDEPEDINESQLTLVALEGSTSYSFLSEVAGEAKLVATANYEQAVQMVIAGEAHALVADYPACVVQMFLHRDTDLVTVTSPFTFEPMGAALPANDPLFVNLVQNYMLMLEGTGLLTQLEAKWFLDGSWLDQL